MATHKQSRTQRIEKTLRRAQSVLGGYIEAGGEQVRDTIGSLEDVIGELGKRARKAVTRSKRRVKRAPTTKKRGKKRGTTRRVSANARRGATPRAKSARTKAASRAAPRPKRRGTKTRRKMATRKARRSAK